MPQRTNGPKEGTHPFGWESGQPRRWALQERLGELGGQASSGDLDDLFALGLSAFDLSVCRGDVVQVIGVKRVERTPALGQGIRQLLRRFDLCVLWEVVAAQKVDADVVEDKRPEGNLRARRVGGVGGDAFA